METYKLLKRIISETEVHETVIEPIKITGRRTVLGYRLATKRILNRNGVAFDYGYVGTVKDAYLPKKALKIDWEAAKKLLSLNSELFN